MDFLKFYEQCTLVEHLPFYLNFENKIILYKSHYNIMRVKLDLKNNKLSLNFGKLLDSFCLR